MADTKDDTFKRLMIDGAHFWAKMDGKLVMMAKFDSQFYVCGGWEVPVNVDEFEFIESVSLPKGYSTNDLYYISW